VIKDSFEAGVSRGDEALMTTKMCLKYENGLCLKYGGNNPGYAEPFILNDGVRRFKVTFDCSRCVMIISSCD
jgi:putative protease